MNFDRTNWQNVMALVPMYGEDGGNDTAILLGDGTQVVVRNKTSTMLDRLAGVFAVDVTRLRHNHGDLLGRHRNVPLPLHKELWLVPVNIRTARSRYDGTVGYLVYQHIIRCEPLEQGCRVIFTGGVSLELPQRMESVQNVLALTRMVGVADEAASMRRDGHHLR